MAAQLHSDQVSPPHGSCDHAEMDGAAKDSHRLSDSFSEGLGLLPAAWRFERIHALRVRAHLNIYCTHSEQGLSGFVQKDTYRTSESFIRPITLYCFKLVSRWLRPACR